MAFKLVKENPETEYVKLRISSQAYTIGDALMLDRTSDAIDVVPATATTTTYEIYAVAMETVAATATSVLACVITPEQVWEASVTNNSNTNHNMQRMVLTSASEVNNTGTDNSTSAGLFMQTGTVGATSAKKVVGKFLKVANVTA